MLLILLCLLCYPVLFFSVMHPGQTVALNLTLYCPNDFFLPKDDPFRGKDDGWCHAGKICPKITPKWVWIGSLKRKCQNLYITISPELLIRHTSDLKTEFRPREALRGWSTITPERVQTTRSTSWVVHHYPRANTILVNKDVYKYNMTDSRHLENRYDVIFPNGWSGLD